MQEKKLTKNEVKHLAKSEWDDLSPRERKLIEIVLEQLDETPNANEEIRDRRTFGEKTADVIATFGGSWTFIIIFFSFFIHVRSLLLFPSFVQSF